LPVDNAVGVVARLELSPSPLLPFALGGVGRVGEPLDRRRRYVADEIGLPRRPRVSRAADRDVLRVPFLPEPSVLRFGNVRRHSAVYLMKISLAEDHDQIETRTIAGALVEVQVDEPAAGTIEPLVVAAERL